MCFDSYYTGANLRIHDIISEKIICNASQNNRVSKKDSLHNSNEF